MICRYFIGVIGLLMFFSCTETSNQSQKIHYNAFSHNDYHREHPLTDALVHRQPPLCGLLRPSGPLRPAENWAPV